VRWAWRAVLACGAAGLAAWVPLAACDRHADIRDEPDSAILITPPALDAGEIQTLDSGLGTDAYPPCEGRPIEHCQGPIDFPCAFEKWVTSTAKSCQKATGCKTDGWVEVKLAADGCAIELGMDHPNDDIVACLLAELGAVRCPCGESEVAYFFGNANDGVCPDGG
jgi:hypothetical protein